MSGAGYQTNNKEAEYFLTHTVVGSLDIFTHHLYQGKEFMDDFGFNLQDFDARMFDSQLGRWHAIDPVMQFASPYVGMGNNPVSLTDPDGRQVAYYVFLQEVEIKPDPDPWEGIETGVEYNFIVGSSDGFGDSHNMSSDGQNSGVSHGSGGNAGGQGGNGVGNSVTTDSEAPSPRTPEEMIQDDVNDLCAQVGNFLDFVVDAYNAREIGPSYDMVSVGISANNGVGVITGIGISVNIFFRGDMGINVSVTDIKPIESFGLLTDMGLDVVAYTYDGPASEITQGSISGDTRIVTAGLEYSGITVISYDNQGRAKWNGHGTGFGITAGAGYLNGNTRIIWP